MKNLNIEFLRFYSAVAVFLFHMGAICSGGYRAVPFFFMLSGYFMLKTLRTHSTTGQSPQEECFTFISKKIKSFYPELIISFTIGTVILFIRAYRHQLIFTTPQLLLEAIMNDLCLLRMTGILNPDMGVNPPVWYLSSMIIGMLLLFPVAKSSYSFILSVLICIAAQACTTYLHPLANPARMLQWNLFIPDGNFTAIGSLSAGFIIYEITTRIKIAQLPYFLNKSSILKYIILALACLTLLDKSLFSDQISWFLWIVYLTCEFSQSQQSSSQSKPFYSTFILILGRISLPLYLAHWHVGAPTGMIAIHFHFIEQFWPMLAFRCAACFLVTGAVMLGARVLRQSIFKQQH